MKKLPWFKFFPGDWIRDPNLRRCSHAARGVWIDMLCLMFECEDRGVLQTAGRAWSDDEIAQAIGGRQDVTVACIVELVDKGVASRTTTGALYSRRLVRDKERQASASSYGKLGGRPASESDPPKKGIERVTQRVPSDFLYLASSSLLTEEFVAAWKSWLEYRRAKGKPVSELAARQQLVKCQSWGVTASVASIEESIRNDWQGLFEPDTKPSPAPVQAKSAPDFLRMAEQAAAQPRDPRRMNL